MASSKYSTAVLATVRYSSTQRLHEMKLLDSEGRFLSFVQFIDIGRDFFVDEYEPGQKPPTGAASATELLAREGLRVSSWRKDDLPGWVADVRAAPDDA